eukprot:2838438-Pyramimonas_sp.AAC.1
MGHGTWEIRVGVRVSTFKKTGIVLYADQSPPCAVTLYNITSFYGSSCVNSGKDAFDTPDVVTSYMLYLSVPRGVEPSSVGHA